MTDLRPWQAAALPLALRSLSEQRQGVGKPGLVAACTGSGKSILIAEILRRILPRLQEGDGIIVTTPTVALVGQLRATIEAHCGIVCGVAYTLGWEISASVVIACNPSAPDLIAEYPRRAALWISDEAHRETPAIIDFASNLPKNCARLGFSATPYRAGSNGQDPRLSLWAQEIYRYSPEDAVRDGVLVPIEIRYPTQTQERIAEIVEQVTRAEGPGVVSARTIAEAEEIAGALTACGVRAAPISSAQSRSEQVALLEQLRAGELRALCYPSLLSEGVDLPWLRWIALYAERNRVRLIQEVGRVLRTAPGKRSAVVIDPGRQIERSGLSFEACLGWGQVSVKERQRQEREQEEEEVLASEPKALKTLLASGDSPFCDYAFSLRQAAAAAGLQIAPLRAGPWRGRPADPIGLLALERWRGAARHLSAPHRRAVEAALSQPATAGQVSDLAAVLRALYKRNESVRGVFDPGFEPPTKAVCERILALDQGAAVALYWRSTRARYPDGEPMRVAVIHKSGACWRVLSGGYGLVGHARAICADYEVFVPPSMRDMGETALSTYKIHEAASRCERDAQIVEDSWLAWQKQRNNAAK